MDMLIQTPRLCGRTLIITQGGSTRPVSIFLLPVMHRFISLFSPLLLAITSLLLHSSGIQAQTDTSFWFVAPEAAAQHGDNPIYFRFATLDQPAVITVSQPANPGFPVQTITLNANDAATLNLTPWIALVENYPPNQILNKAFYISSTARIMAYYEISPTCNCNPDIFALKGSNALGTAFLIPFQNYLNNASYARPAFHVAATQNNTTITIVPTVNIVGHSAGTSITITLNAGQSWCGEGISTQAALHPGGTTVVSDKPVVVTMSDDSLQGTPYGGCADIIGDQIVPIPILGTSYIALKGYLNGPDKVYVLASQPGTQIFADGSPVGTFNVGQTYVNTLSNPTLYITASQPVYVLHVTGFGCEVGGALLPPVECTGSNSVAFVRSTDEFIALNILVPAGGQGAFTLNGVAGPISPAAFQFVPSTNNEWMYAQITVTNNVTVGQASRLENSVNRFHLGMIHGGANSGCRYGYFSDYSAFKYQIQLTGSAQICEGETLAMSVLPIPGALYNWQGPNGFASVGTSTSIPDISELNEGMYVIDGFEGICPILPDTLMLTVHPVFTTPVSAEICAGAAYTIGSETFTESGQFAGMLFTTTGCDSLINLSLTVRDVYDLSFSATTCSNTPYVWNGQEYPEEGEYPVMFSTIYGCDSLMTLQLTLSDTYETSFSDAICGGQTYSWLDETFDGTGSYERVLSSVAGCDSLVTLHLAVHPTYSIPLNTTICAGETYSFNGQEMDSSGNYPFLFSTLEGCDSLITVNLNVIPLSTTNLPVTLCGEETFFFEGTLYDTPGSYPVMLQSPAGCDSLVTVQISSYPEYTTLLVDTICAGERYWFAGDWVEMDGIYEASLMSVYGCDSLVTLYLEYWAPEAFQVVFPNVFTPNRDGINDTFGASGSLHLIGEYTLQVYNRWGAVVFESSTVDRTWDGTIGGTAAGPGAYYYIAVFRSRCNPGEVLKQSGNVMLLE